jgi:hypothetical protein
LGVAYFLPPVEIDREDIEWLWKEITALFDADPNSTRVDMRSSLTIEAGRGLNEIELDGPDLTPLLRSAFLRGTITALRFTFRAKYNNPREERSLSLSLDAQWKTRVKLDGPDGWNLRASALLDKFLKGKASRNGRNRWLAFFALELLIIIATYFLVTRLDLLSSFTIDPERVRVILSLLVGSYALLIWLGVSPLLRIMYPLSRLTIDPQIQPPWYTHRAKELLMGIIGGLIAIILAAQFIHP